MLRDTCKAYEYVQCHHNFHLTQGYRHPGGLLCVGQQRNLTTFCRSETKRNYENRYSSAREPSRGEPLPSGKKRDWPCFFKHACGDRN